MVPPFAAGVLLVLLAMTNKKELPTATSISACLEAMLQGTLTPTDLVEDCLSRIHREASNSSGKLSAFVTVDQEGARLQAEQRTAELALRRSRHELDRLGPLHGIPIAVKDIIDVKDMPTQAGSPLRQKDVAAPCTHDDAPVVAALRQAGAIILGKTVTTEWAHLDPDPRLRNPWSTQSCTPGGSSSGSAVAVAMGMSMGAVGTQTGGSILRPASFCGICGLKPTFAQPSTAIMQGIVPVSFHLDHVGPMARTVADLEILYDVMTCSPSSFSRSLALDEPPILSRLNEYFVDTADTAVQRAFEKALQKLEGAKWREASKLPTSFSTVHHCHYVIMAVDAAQVHAQAFHNSPEQFAPRITELIQDGLRTELADYVASLRHQQQFRSEISQRIQAGGSSLWIMCSTPTTAPGPETTGDARFNSPWSYCGLPAVTIPCGVDDEKGLPVGIQIVAPHGGERDLLSAARWCQDRIGFMDYDELPRP